MLIYEGGKGHTAAARRRVKSKKKKNRPDLFNSKGKGFDLEKGARDSDWAHARGSYGYKKPPKQKLKVKTKKTRPMPKPLNYWSKDVATQLANEKGI